MKAQLSFFKRIAASVLALALALSMTACGGESEDISSDVEPSPVVDTDIGTDTQSPAGDNGSTEGSGLSAQLPTVDGIDLDEGTWVEQNGYSMLVFSYGFDTYTYESGLFDMSYHLGHSSDMEYDCGLIRDYWSDYNADPDIRIVEYDPNNVVIIFVGRPFPEDDECWELAAALDEKSELRMYFSTYTSALDQNNGEWIEQDGYAAMLFPNIDDDTILDTVEENIGHFGFSLLSSSVVGNAELRTYKQKGSTDIRYIGYDADTQTAVVMVGELPTEYTCWLLLGKTKDELGEPSFEGSVKDYMPDDAESCIRVRYADGLSESDELREYQVCGVSLTRLEEYIAELDAMGYEHTAREDNGDRVYYEARLKAYKELDIYVTAQLAWSDGKLTYAFSAPGYELEKDAMMEIADGYTGIATGRDPNAAPEEGYKALELSAATSVETDDGATIYYFEGGYPLQSARLYIEELTQQGYRDEQMPYIPDVKPYQVEYAHNWLFKEGMGDQSWIIVMAWNQKAMVITSAEEPNYREHELWEMVDYSMTFGVGYLETVYHEFRDEHGVIGIDGESWDSNGYFANYGYGCSMDDVNWMIGELEDAGFTYSRYYPLEDGAEMWVYSRNEGYDGLNVFIYARILLKGDFAEVEFGYSARDYSQNLTR